MLYKESNSQTERKRTSDLFCTYVHLDHIGKENINCLRTTIIMPKRSYKYSLACTQVQGDNLKLNGISHLYSQTNANHFYLPCSYLKSSFHLKTGIIYRKLRSNGNHEEIRIRCIGCTYWRRWKSTSGVANRSAIVLKWLEHISAVGE